MLHVYHFMNPQVKMYYCLECKMGELYQVRKCDISRAPLQMQHSDTYSLYKCLAMNIRNKMHLRSVLIT